jgi:hypothetical protein
MPSKLDREISVEAAAIERFVLSACLPIVREGQERPEPWGTGTLFKFEDRYFLVTARHVLETDRTRLAFPIKLTIPPTLKNITLQTFGEMNIYTNSHLNSDVAVVELMCPEAVELLGLGWSFLGVNNLAKPGTVHGRFVLTGYPVEMHEYDGGNIHQSVLTLYTDPLGRIPLVRDPDPEYDQFYHLQKEGETINGINLMIPALNGASGASIWVYNRDWATSIWTPEATLKIVGVQRGASQERTWFRGASWRAVRDILVSEQVGLRNLFG